MLIPFVFLKTSMNAWIQICTAVLDNSVSVLIFRAITPVNARMDCSTSTTLARVRKNIIIFL